VRELASIVAALKAGRPPVEAQPIQQPGFYVPHGVLEDLSVFGDVNLATATPEEIAAAIGRASQPPTTGTVSKIGTMRPSLPGAGLVAADPSTTATQPEDEATTAPKLEQDGTTATLRRQDPPPDPRGGGAPDPAEGGLPPKPTIPDFAASQPDKPRQPAKPIQRLSLAAKYQSPIYRLESED
jgi:hypothetical protein